MIRTILILAGLLGATAASPAQFILVPGPPVALAGGASRFGFSLGLGYSSRFQYSAGFYSQWFSPIPVWGWAPVWPAMPPVIVVPQPPVVIAGFAARQGRFEPEESVPAARPAPREDPELARGRVEAAVERGDLLVVRPNAPVRPRLVPEVAPAVMVPEPPLPNDPKQLAALRVELARKSLAQGEVGRAADHLEAAIRLTPEVPLPYFLLAQVRTERGEYLEAVAAIRSGMSKAPDWPTSGFRLKELYGPTPERFDGILRELQAVAARNPDDATVGFLAGYHLWFLGQKDAAVKLFRQATRRVKDNAIIERFLVEFDLKS